MFGNGIAIRGFGTTLTALLLGCLSGSFVAGGLPARAEGTAASTVITSTASATYNDPDNTDTTIDALSNTVMVTVADVAGITVSAGAITNTTTGHGGTILPGDVVSFDFTVTNIGNAPTLFALPGSAAVTEGSLAGTLQYSLDGVTFTPIPAGGLAATASVAPGGTVRVRVPVTVSTSTMTGSVVKVLLGSTGENDNSAGTQNILDPDPDPTSDVYTSSATAQNGRREASFFQSVTVGSQPQALALILLTRTGVVRGTPPAGDLLTYALEMKVSTTLPVGPRASQTLTVADLAPTAIRLDGRMARYVLITNAIPAGTVLSRAAYALPRVISSPPDWVAVYTTTPTATVATEASWTTTVPADLAAITRIGYVTSRTLAAGSTVRGFFYAVTINSVVTTVPIVVANLAQVFGQTAGDASNALVVDESGDQYASNFGSDGSRGTSPIPTGVANPAVDGTDTNNNNGGAGGIPGGWDNVYTVLPRGMILNGPNGEPGATGPTGSSDDDFTNQSAPIAAGTTAGTTVSPAAVTFTNTLQNPAATPLGSSVLLRPGPCAAPGDLPADTTLTLTCSGKTVLYRYGGTEWTLISGPVLSLPGLAAGTSVSYTAAVQLPANRPLSTDSGIGFPVTIRAFVDTDGDGQPGTEEPANQTIDRVYTGFLRVTQLARIVASDGTTIIQDYGNGPISAEIYGGRFIDYQISYTNISTEAGAGVGNALLNATGTTIIADGAARTNNWALTRPNGILLTSNVPGSALDSGGGTVTFYNGNPPVLGTDKSGTTPAADVTLYTATATSPIAPGTSRTFTFRRKIN